jgi:regulator of nonsense transcripts 1
MMQFSKPRKLINTTNPGGRFMNSTMFNAREVLIPGSAYDRSGGQSAAQLNGGAFFSREQFLRVTHDQMGYIPQDRGAYHAAMNLPVPIGMFMSPMASFQQQTMQPQGGYLLLSGPLTGGRFNPLSEPTGH